MLDAQTPQQALEIAATTTRQAHDAAALPSWGPVAAGFFAGLYIALVGMAITLGMDNSLAWIAALAAIASGLVYYAIVRWLRRIRRERGLVPLPLAPWKFIVVLLVVLAIPDFGLATSILDGWVQLLSGLIMGGWIWFEQARPRTAPWKTRQWTAPWKN